MELISWTDLGVAGLLILMTFQYVIKPLMNSFLEKRRGNNNPGNPACHDCAALNQVVDILGKKDNKERPLVWGYCTKEAIEELAENVKKLTEIIEDKP